MTPRQLAIVLYLIAYRNVHGYGPSLREIAAEFGIRSENGVAGHLVLLKKKGLVDWVPQKSRTLRACVEWRAA